MSVWVAGAILVVVCGCGAAVGPAQPWVEADTVAPPLQAEFGSELATAKASLADPPPSVRVVSYNVDGPDGITPAAIADTLLGDPDLALASVVLIQEIESHPGAPRSDAAELAERLGMDFVFVPARLREGSVHGLAILSTFPIMNTEKMDLPWVRGRPRIAVRASLLVGGQILEVIDVHLDPSLNSSERLAQLRPAVIDAPDRVLVAGDFNSNWLEFIGTSVPVATANPAADQSKALDSYMAALRFAAVSAGSGTTAHASGFEARLDGIYARGLAARFGAVVHTGPSDHWPLWADVTLP